MSKKKRDDPQAQWRAYLLRIHAELEKLDCERYFTSPVDITLVEDYYDIVKSPMCLDTIRKNITRRHYETMEQLKADVQLIVSNAQLYNEPDTPYYEAASQFKQEAETLFVKYRSLEDFLSEDLAQAAKELATQKLEKEKKQSLLAAPSNATSQKARKRGRPKKSPESAHDKQRGEAEKSFVLTKTLPALAPALAPALISALEDSVIQSVSASVSPSESIDSASQAQDALDVECISVPASMATSSSSSTSSGSSIFCTWKDFVRQNILERLNDLPNSSLFTLPSKESDDEAEDEDFEDEEEEVAPPPSSLANISKKLSSSLYHSLPEIWNDVESICQRVQPQLTTEQALQFAELRQAAQSIFLKATRKLRVTFISDKPKPRRVSADDATSKDKAVELFSATNITQAEVTSGPLDDFFDVRVPIKRTKRVEDPEAAVRKTKNGSMLSFLKVCNVCRSSERTLGEKLLQCAGCGVAVHDNCYGTPARPSGGESAASVLDVDAVVPAPAGLAALFAPAAKWFCDGCKTETKAVDLACALCFQKGGALKRTSKGDAWVHIACVDAIPELFYHNPEEKSGVSDLSKINKLRRKLVCLYCQKKAGACIQCQCKTCRVSYHVTCALDRSYPIHYDAETCRAISFCSKHIDQYEDYGITCEPSALPFTQAKQTPPSSEPKEKGGSKAGNRKRSVQKGDTVLKDIQESNQTAASEVLPPESQAQKTKDNAKSQGNTQRQRISGARKGTKKPLLVATSPILSGVCQICLQTDKEVPFLSCKDCGLQVHSECYGLESENCPPDGSWACSPCSAGTKSAQCAICPVAGGALKQTVCGSWAHIVCVETIPELYYTVPDTKDMICALTQANPKRQTLVCMFCQQKKKGLCIQCSHRSCFKAYHASCALMSGVKLVFQPVARSVKIHSFCSTHKQSYDILEKKATQEKRDQMVIYGPLLETSQLPKPAEQCDVCFVDSFTSSNKILTCQGCKVPVHQLCYNAHSLPNGEWYCKSCELKRSQENNTSSSSVNACAFCETEGGALLPLGQSHMWVHASCMKCHQLESVVDPTTGCVIMENLQAVKTLAKGRACSVCHSSSGMTIQCETNGCGDSFHAKCGALHGYQLRASSSAQARSQALSSAQNLCKAHCAKESSSTAVANPVPSKHIHPKKFSGKQLQSGEEDTSVCSVCLAKGSEDGDLLHCKNCRVLVHKDCYGEDEEVEGPEWLCSPCKSSKQLQAFSNSPAEASEAVTSWERAGCVFCPVKEGALKATSCGNWAHIICALYIPEVTFGNPSKLEPILNVDRALTLRKCLKCAICHKRNGCIQCTVRTCRVAFHPLCARKAGYLLHEVETSTGLNMVAYCPKHTQCAAPSQADAEPAAGELPTSAAGVQKEHKVQRNRPPKELPQTKSDAIVSGPSSKAMQGTTEENGEPFPWNWPSTNLAPPRIAELWTALNKFFEPKAGSALENALHALTASVEASQSEEESPEAGETGPNACGENSEITPKALENTNPESEDESEVGAEERSIAELLEKALKANDLGAEKLRERIEMDRSFVLSAKEAEDVAVFTQMMEEKKAAEEERRKQLQLLLSAKCSVCQSGVSEFHNQILFCDRCNVPIHQQCYGVKKIPTGDWYCQACCKHTQTSMEGEDKAVSSSESGQEVETPTASCSVCLQTGGALKQADNGGFVHVVCARATPALSFSSTEEDALVRGMARLLEEQKPSETAVCAVCRLSQGILAKCQGAHCSSTFHAKCLHGLGMLDLPPPSQSSPSSIEALQLLCARHFYKERNAHNQQAQVENQRIGPGLALASLSKTSVRPPVSGERQEKRCHRCWKLCSMADLKLCSGLPTPCKARFCGKCIQRHFNENPTVILAGKEPWACYLCRDACTCYRCRKKEELHNTKWVVTTGQGTSGKPRQSASGKDICALCTCEGGTLLTATTGEAVHKICAQVVPEVYVIQRNVHAVEIGSLSAIPRARWNSFCRMCKKQNSGATVKCIHPKCERRFHGFCANKVGRVFSSDGLSYVLCKQHAEKLIVAEDVPIMKKRKLDCASPPPRPKDLLGASSHTTPQTGTASIHRKSPLSAQNKDKQLSRPSIASEDTSALLPADAAEAMMAPGVSPFPSTHKRIRKVEIIGSEDESGSGSDSEEAESASKKRRMAGPGEASEALHGEDEEVKCNLSAIYV